MSLELRDQHVVVIGGTSGMGRAAARLAQQAGARVTVAGRRPVQERPVDTDFAQAVVDVTREESVKALFDSLGGLDHLLVTAAPAPSSLAAGGDFSEQRAYVDAKLYGSWMSAHYAAPHMAAGGSITFVTGCAVVRPPRGAPMVPTAFAALESLGRALALELGPIRVNTLRPGLVDSEMWSFLDDEARGALRTKASTTLPAGRMGRPDDIGRAALFLMTNSYVTGSVLEVSGGEPLVNLS
jgi:NAD(P)-dependent dehydrogenase (short-subunit alcohol dehydrogenase family)